MSKDIIVIGAGFAGLSAACFLAKAGYAVTVLEKNDGPGGRARMFEQDGFRFDMGPSWYWMPDVFEDFFAQFGKKPSDYYDLVRLDPSYRIFFGQDNVMDVPAGTAAITTLFETIEPGSTRNLEIFLSEARQKYEISMGEFVFRPSLSIKEFFDVRILKALKKLQVFTSLSAHVRRLFRDERLIKLLEFPVLFLGATPENTPAMYSMMNYADIALGTWYPKGGMVRIVEAQVALAKSLGVRFEFNSEVKKINTADGEATGVVLQDGRLYPADVVVAGADYHHAEQDLLKEQDRRYSETYWDNRVMAPSCLIYYLGVNKPVNNLLHHNLFFDRDFNQHAHDIYEKPGWPGDPLFYVCAASKTDETIAPAGHENLFVLIPIAPGLTDDPAIREKYYNMVMDRMEALTGEKVRESVVFRRDYGPKDFILDYHAYKGNAYGLANTLLQTAILKPQITNPKVKNLYYTGQLTVPGPGVPPALISGRIVADQIILKNNKTRKIG
jgi:phytoene desaturase